MTTTAPTLTRPYVCPQCRPGCADIESHCGGWWSCTCECGDDDAGSRLLAVHVQLHGGPADGLWSALRPPFPPHGAIEVAVELPVPPVELDGLFGFAPPAIGSALYARDETGRYTYVSARPYDDR